jgi:uncharacterized protein YdcH (DUF465 family)
MTTKVAIEFLAQSQNSLTAFLTGLGLLGNNAALVALKAKFEAYFADFLEEYNELQEEVTQKAAEIKGVSDRLGVAQEYAAIEEERLQALLLEKKGLEGRIAILIEQKVAIETGSTAEKQGIQDKITLIKQDIVKTETDLAKRRQEISNREIAIGTYRTQISALREQEAYHNSLAAQYDQQSRYWGVTGSGRSGKKEYGWLIDHAKVQLRDQQYGLAAAASQRANELAGKIGVLQKEISDAKPLIPAVERELIGHILRLEAQKDLLSLSGLDLAQKLETVNLQIQQESSDLAVLNGTTIPQQQGAVDGATTKLGALQSDLGKLQGDKATAAKNLADFEEKYAYLLAEDVTGFLGWSVGTATPEVVKLRQQLLAVDGLAVVEDRLSALVSQSSAEEAVKGALAVNTVEGYVRLGGALAAEIRGLSDIWRSNLQESHGWTVKVFNLSEEQSQAVKALEVYTEGNLADPYGDYVLDKIQLEERIALQQAQVAYRDGLAGTVDGLEEAIAVFEKRVEQAKVLGEKIEHIQDLTTFESDYTALKEALNKLGAVDKADYELANKNIKNIAEYLLKKLGSNEQYKLVSDKLRLALDNYNSFATANSQEYINKYSSYIDIVNKQRDDVKRIQDEKDSKSQAAIRNWQAVRSDVTGNYYFLTPARDWSGAQAIAQSAGGNLVTINNQDEQNWLFQRYKSYVWIGLSDHIQEGVWRWVSGEPVTYSNWLPNQPDNWDGIEDFVQLNLTGDGRWNDLPHVGIHNGNIPGMVELNFQKYDQQIQAVNDRATADKARVASEIQSLHDRGIKIFISQTAEVLRPLLIDKLDDEIDIKVSDLPNQIELTNDEQEQWIETNLRKYIEDKENKILDVKNQQLKSVDITQTNLAFSSQQDGFNALNITSAGFGLGYDNRHRFMADVNGDGRADFGRFEGGGNGTPISLYFNLAGENGFTNQIYQLTPGTDIGYDNRHRFMADVNGDGRADFGRFVGSGNGTPIFLSFNLAGENGFTNQIYQLTSGTDIGYDNRHRFMADVNGDGRADFGRFVGGGNGTPISLSFNLAGENGFTNQIYQLTPGTDIGYDNRHRFMADVNGDGRADFGRFVGGGNGTPISLSFNLAGENGFTNQIYQLTPGTDIGYDDLPRFMEDVNGDGRADFGRFVGGGNGTPIYLSFVLAGENGFSSNQYAFNTIKAGFDRGYDNRHRFMADVNGDGRADFGRFVGGGNGTPIYLSFNSAQSPQHELELIQPIEDKAISDLQNLRVETAYLTLQAEQDPNKLQKYLQTHNALKVLGTTDNQATDLSLFDIVTPLGSVYQDALRSDPGAWIIRGDYNGDGKTDFIRQEHGAWDDDPMATFSVYFSKGDGYFDVVIPLDSKYQDALRGDNGAFIIPGDYNGDGKTDFIRQEHGSWGSDTVGTFSIYFSKGDGNFDVFTPLGSQYQDALRATPGAWIIPGDYNGDGKTDFIRQEHSGWGSDTVGTFSIYFSKGDGNFDIIAPLGSQYQDSLRHSPGANIIPGDYNGDGKTDFIRQEHSGTAGWGSDTVGTFSIYFSKGDGNFDIVTPLGTEYQDALRGTPGVWITPGDYNGDGKTDFIRQEHTGTAGWGSDTVGTFSIYLSKGNGYFDIVTPLGTQYQDALRGTPGARIISGDYNGDGYSDFIRQETGVWDDDTVGTFSVYFSNPAKQEALKLLESNDTVKNLTLTSLRTQYYPTLNDATTLASLKTQIDDELTTAQTNYNKLKNEIAEKQAASAASLSQAKWYEDQAQIHWDLSRKAGPTWNEYRTSRGRSGKSETITITHLDHNWIIWDAYTQQAASLRQYAASLDKRVGDATTEKKLTDSIISQWQQANAVADQAQLTYDQLLALLQTLEAQRQLLPKEQAQLDTFKALLPTLQTQLATAQTAAEQAKTNTTTAQTEFDTSSQTYQTALQEVLSRKTTLETKTQNLLQQIANSRAWVEQESLALDTEINETITLKTSLETQLNTLLPPSPGGDTADNLTKIAQISQSLNLLTHKQTILTAQKAALTQKITLLNAQKTVIETEHKLILATIASPDDDYSNLQDQLTDAQKTLIEVQKLAEQAEESSIILSASLENLQSYLKLQNDQYLAEINGKQKTLQTLIDAVKLKENYTLQAQTKQLELNTLETQLIARLTEAKNAGSQQADYLLQVASANNFATAAEIYYRDYRDLMTDQGGGCAGGIARPEDAVKADYYYHEMLKYRALERQAQQQADTFAQIKNTAQGQIDLIKQTQTTAQLEYNQIQRDINNLTGDINELNQKLQITEIRIDALEYLRNWTEQTLVQLLQVEQLNLVQAQLEQQFAQNRQEDLTDTLKAIFEKQRADINRDRAIATTKLEQLNQLRAEDALQQALNDLRTDLGLQPIEDIVKLAEYKGQLAGLLSDLDSLQQKPDLPDSLKTLLGETTAVIHDALQGKEAATIQDNLLKSANALITEANRLQTALTQLDAEETRLTALLTQSETDLQGAAKALYDEIDKAKLLGEQFDGVNQQYLEVLYRVGYAQGAVDLSSELAQQSKTIIDQIITGRIAERKIRKKASVNEIFSTVTLVIAVAAAVITAGQSLYLYATVPGITGTSAIAAASQLTAVVALQTVGASLSAIQSAYNGDWKGAIFNAGMAALGAAELGGFKLPDIGLNQAVKDLGIKSVSESFKGFANFGEVRQFASGLYNGANSSLNCITV